MSYTIAIDGYSACGKSTLAKAMARQLGYRYIDTGAMYRMVTLHFQRNAIDINDEGAVAGALTGIEIDFVPGSNDALLFGENVEGEIRGLTVGRFVSPVAAIPAVRRAMVAQQRIMGADGSVVMDGRDIGTIVFPEADLKLFVTADLETRTDRRLSELVSSGKNPSREDVAKNLQERDHIDSTRADSPLMQADDAIVLDNSDLNLPEFIEKGIELVRRIEK